MAGAITAAVVEEIKARTDLVDLVSSYGIRVQTAGGSAKACCPFHSEKTPSFNINAAKGFYHCFGCGESGDAIAFVRKMEGLGFVEAAKKLAAACGVAVEEREDPDAGRRKRLYALMAELSAFYRRCLLKTKEAAPARAYLAARDLGDDAQEMFQIGYAPAGAKAIFTWARKYGFTDEELEAAGVVKLPSGPGDQGYHRFGGRLMFSICDRQGRVVAFSGRQIVENKRSGKYVNSPETPIFKKSRVLFGFHRAAAAIAKAPHREAIVCEGQIDAIRLHLNGFPVAVASQGTAFTEEHVRMLKKVADAAVLVFDDDAAGRKAAVRTAGLFLAADIPVRLVRLPDGEDPDSFLRTKGGEAFRALLAAAESVVAYQCRAETEKERDPRSIDAVARISRAVLSTIALCPNALLRATLVAEAARCLGLPPDAVAQELERRLGERASAPRAAVSAVSVEPSPAEDGDIPADEPEIAQEAFAGSSARDAEPPPAREVAFLEFLMSRENEASLDGEVGALLPESLFVHPFSRAFVKAWREEIATGEDRLAPFAQGLSAVERAWFDGIYLRAGRVQACGLPASDVLRDFARLLWSDAIERERGALPAAGTAQDDAARMRLSLELQRFKTAPWDTVASLIRKRTKGEP
jgi:DNA primase